MSKDIYTLNQTLQEKSPAEIIKWGLENAKNPVLTTNFRPYEIAILYLCVQAKEDIKIVWCDTGFNTKAIYVYAKKIISELKLNINVYKPKEKFLGEIPGIENPLHKVFTEQVKLEPFRRAMYEIKPDIWITNLRKGQTTFRDSIDIISQTDEGLLKLSPFYNWSDQDLDDYMKENNLINEYDYYDPTKADEKRECGLHDL